MNKLKYNLIAVALAFGGAFSASATLVYQSGTLNFDITDDGNLYSQSITISGNSGAPITDLNVSLNISGGYNADLYAYLLYDNLAVVLLNRIGMTESNPWGAAGAGMNVTLSDGATDIHSAGDGVLSGTWAPDGRTISPLSTGIEFDAANRQNSGNPLATFNNLNPNGTWTLFLADMESGEQSQLVSWSLIVQQYVDPAAVPEPGLWGLFIFGGSTVVLGRLVQRRLRDVGLKRKAALDKQKTSGI